MITVRDDWYNKAVQALLKQEEKPVVKYMWGEDIIVISCGACHRPLASSRIEPVVFEESYCAYCGQKLKSIKSS